MAGKFSLGRLLKEASETVSKGFVANEDLRLRAAAAGEIDLRMRNCVYPEDSKCPVERQFLPVLMLRRAEAAAIRDKEGGRDRR